jgi:hypothetical protein
MTQPAEDFAGIGMRRQVIELLDLGSYGNLLSVDAH